MSEYAVIHVRDGASESWPVVERVSGGWQSGAHHYPDATVLGVRTMVLVQPDEEWWMKRDTAIHRRAQVQILNEIGNGLRAKVDEITGAA